MSDLPRGLRNKNPGNLRHVPGTTWLGEAPEQTDSAFVQFTDAKYGIRALARILTNYEKRGIGTLSAAINRFAPPNENNSDAYVQAVCTECGIGPFDFVSLTSIMPSLVKAIIRHENGQQPYTDTQIAEGIALA